MLGVINKVRAYRWYWLGRRTISQEIKRILQEKKPLKIILGASETGYDGWIATDLPHFDASKTEDWDYFFSKKSIDNLLAEHVYEHLTLEQTKKSFLLLKEYLKPGAVFRIAVPDGYHDSPAYIDYVKPGTEHAGWLNHQVLWNRDLLAKMADDCGFEATFLQYYTRDHQLIDIYKDDENGIIMRTSEKYKTIIEYSFPYTSLIADLRPKP
ncbi:MAG TPA: hypothetical protein VGO45_09015 [Bacteroidia bacterium]|jgi:predicted SAM-dependent methyltransferase|nr:hypothetical protein [Bacteroidia bacterium]